MSGFGNDHLLISVLIGIKLFGCHRKNIDFCALTLCVEERTVIFVR